VHWSWYSCACRLSWWILWLRRELWVLPRPAIVPCSDSRRLGLCALLCPCWHPIRSNGPPPSRAPLSRRGALFLWHRLSPSCGLTQSRAQYAGLNAQHLQRDVWPQHTLHDCVPQWQRIHQPAVTALLRNERRHCLVNRPTPNYKAHLDIEGKLQIFFFYSLFKNTYLSIYLFICLHFC